jgi:hypothetical protein
MAHFLSCTESKTAEKSANLFLHGIYRLHGLPRVLVTDRDPKFINGYWKTLWQRLGKRFLVDTRRRMDKHSASTSRFSSFFVASVATTELIGLTYCLK